MAPKGGHVEVAKAPSLQDDVTYAVDDGERRSQLLLGLGQVAIPEQDKAQVEYGEGDIVLTDALFGRQNGRSGVGYDLLVDAVAGLAGLLDSQGHIEALPTSWRPPGFDNRAGLCKDRRSCFRLVAPVVDIRPTGQLDFEPQVDDLLVEVLWVLPEQLVGCVEGGYGCVIVGGRPSRLGPSGPGGEQPAKSPAGRRGVRLPGAPLWPLRDARCAKGRRPTWPAVPPRLW